MAEVKSLSHVRFFATPRTIAYQPPWSMGFSRQEYWSGLPFPSPMHENGKWKWSRSVMSDSQWPHGLQPTRLLCPWDFPGKNTGVGCHFLLQGIFPTQESNQTLQLGKQILYPEPERLMWVQVPLLFLAYWMSLERALNPSPNLCFIS